MFVLKRTKRSARSSGRGLAYDLRKPDVDNLEKSLLDGLVAAGVLRDDCLVFDLRAIKLIADADGRPHARVAVEWLPDPGV